MLPPFDADTGRLSEGEHTASWDELVDRFAWTPRRRQLLDGLAEAIELLAEAGCTRIWLNGSFVTAKDEPADFDACWDPDSVAVDTLDPVFFDFASGRATRRRGSRASCSRTWSSRAAASPSPTSSRTNETVAARASS